jgi:hypothetical protein
MQEPSERCGHWQHDKAVTACRGGVWGTGQQAPLYVQLETGALTSPCGGSCNAWRLAAAARLQFGLEPFGTLGQRHASWGETAEVLGSSVQD